VIDDVGSRDVVRIRCRTSQMSDQCPIDYLDRFATLIDIRLMQHRERRHLTCRFGPHPRTSGELMDMAAVTVVGRSGPGRVGQLAADVHEHVWRSRSRHSTSDGVLSYQHCDCAQWRLLLGSDQVVARADRNRWMT
jgi:hypothetical protein